MGVRRRSLRVRITAGALVVVVGALCAGGLLLIGVLERELVAQIDTTLRANADFVDRSLRAGAALPAGEGPTDLYVQFVAADGTVLGASSAAQGLPALATPPVSGDDDIRTVRSPALGELRVLAQPAPTDPDLLLVVARPSGSVSEVRDSLVRLLVVLVLAGSVLLGAVVWVVVGRALHPVDAMRRRVSDIGERDLRRRLDEPGTGDELDELATTLNDLLARLDVAVAREREFVADASHELRTPLAAARALLETEPADPAEVVAVRAEALARLAQLQDLVDELLTLAQADAVAADAPAWPVDLDELVLGQARQLARTTTLRIDTSRVSGGQVRGRDTELGRLVQNLATNAARHARTTVAFSVQEHGGVVELAVSDDGPGIAAADRARIFERFGTLGGPRSSGHGGAGLGLSIASAIVASHHGSIRAEDAPGTGARFVVELPVQREGSRTTLPTPSRREANSS
jgi:signal transduction histidine kinase